MKHTRGLLVSELQGIKLVSNLIIKFFLQHIVLPILTYKTSVYLDFYVHTFHELINEPGVTHLLFSLDYKDGLS